MIKRIDCGTRLSGAVVSGGHVYISGQVADERSASVEEQTRQVLAKIDALLDRAGTSRSKLVAVNVYLPNILDFAAMTAVYEGWIIPGEAPARTTTEARLADSNLRVEINAIASL